MPNGFADFAGWIVDGRVQFMTGGEGEFLVGGDVPIHVGRLGRRHY